MHKDTRLAPKLISSLCNHRMMREDQYLGIPGKLCENLKAGLASLVVEPDQDVIDNERESLVLFTLQLYGGES